ncbi:phosphotransferase [uncultured Tateyamaria sp.]|uniref:phosphotransferase n=1 Tax=uncultured Tateyamaria sp. TaxID=455651 RepID=UPI0026338CBC|nr:phosphotransferase [uncultured Tateyamaria sp.]
MKLDVGFQARNEFTDEYQRMIKLSSIETGISGFQVARPVFLGERCISLFTECCPGNTAEKHLNRMTCADDVKESFSTLGRWMKGFHSAHKQDYRKSWPGWILSKVTSLMQNKSKLDETFIDSELVQRAYQHTSKLLQPLKGQPTLFAVQHGDVNKGNFIIDGNSAWAVDFGPEKYGPAALEISKMLLFDLLRPSSVSELSHNGMSRSSLKGFLAEYGDPFLPNELQFYCLAQLLLRYISTTSERYAFSVYQRKRQKHIEQRLRLAVGK